MNLLKSESYDLITKRHRRIYSLDNQDLCFLSFFTFDLNKLDSISFDVEAVDDYH